MSQKQIGSGLQVIGAVALVLAAFVFAGLGLALLALAVVCLVFGYVIEVESSPSVDPTEPAEREKRGDA